MKVNGCMVLLVLALLAGVAYGQVLWYPFVHDDVVFILQNPRVHDLSFLSSVFAPQHFAPQSLTIANAYYRPLLDIVYALEYRVFADHAAGYHFINIIVHVLNAGLVYFLTRNMLGRTWFAWATAILFLLHPVQSESVACISGISNLLSGFFLLASLSLYLPIANERKELHCVKEMSLYFASLICFGLALLAKEQAIVLPVLILLYECVLCNNRNVNPHWRLRISGFVIFAGGYLLWRKIVLGGVIPMFVSNLGEFVLRLKSLPGVLLTHIRVILMPTDLHYYRSYDILSPWIGAWLGLVLLFVVLVGVGLKIAQKWRTFYYFSWVWFFVSLLPMTSLIPLIHEYSWIAAFEHFLYLPIIGFLWGALLLAEFCADRILHQGSQHFKKVALVFVILLSLTLLLIQNRTWASEVPLFEKVVKFEPGLGRARLLLAKAYYFQGNYEKAMSEFKAAQNIMVFYLSRNHDERVKPFYLGFIRESLFGLAACHQDNANPHGSLQEARKYYQEILTYFPEDYASHNNLGFLAIQAGHWAEAVVHFEEALKAEPKNSQILTNLGVCYIQQGLWDQAETHFRAALKVDANYRPAQQNLNRLLEQKVQKKNEL